jgi:hypothetical protein
MEDDFLQLVTGAASGRGSSSPEFGVIEAPHAMFRNVGSQT